MPNTGRAWLPFDTAGATFLSPSAAGSLRAWVTNSQGESQWQVEGLRLTKTIGAAHPCTCLMQY